MSKSFSLSSPSLHTMPMVVWEMKNVLVGNGQYVGVLFVVPVVIDLYGHRFELCTLDSEIRDNGRYGGGNLKCV